MLNLGKSPGTERRGGVVVLSGKISVIPILKLFYCRIDLRGLLHNLGHRDGGQEGVHDHGPLLPPSEHLDQIGLPESKVEQEKASEGEDEEGEGALEVIRVGGEEEEVFSKPGPVSTPLIQRM